MEKKKSKEKLGKVLNWFQILFSVDWVIQRVKKKKVLLKQINFKYLFLFSGTSAITQLKSRPVAFRELLHHLAACCTQEVVLFPLCLYWPSPICWSLYNSCSVIKAHSKCSWLQDTCLLSLDWVSVCLLHISATVLLNLI